MWGEAERQVTRWMESPEKPMEEPQKRITLSEAVQKYLAKQRVKNRAASTITSYSKTLQHFEVFMQSLRKQYPEDIRMEDYDGFQASRLEFTTPKTRRKEVEHLRAFCAFCVEREWMRRNYAKSLEAPDDGTMPTLPFTKEEIHILLAAVDEIQNANRRYLDYARKRMRAMILTLCYTGFRISDAVELDRTRLLPDGTLRLRQHKTGGWVLARLPQDTITALEAIPPDPVAPTPIRRHFFWNGVCKLTTVTGSFRRSMDSLGAKTGINVHPHRFRDTFAVTLLEQGEDIRTVSLLLGHTSIKTTEKHYAHFVKSTQDRLLAAVSKLDFSKREATAGQLIPFPS